MSFRSKREAAHVNNRNRIDCEKHSHTHTHTIRGVDVGRPYSTYGWITIRIREYIDVFDEENPLEVFEITFVVC